MDLTEVLGDFLAGIFFDDADRRVVALVNQLLHLLVVQTVAEITHLAQICLLLLLSSRLQGVVVDFLSCRFFCLLRFLLFKFLLRRVDDVKGLDRSDAFDRDLVIRVDPVRALASAFAIWVITCLLAQIALRLDQFELSDARVNLLFCGFYLLELHLLE